MLLRAIAPNGTRFSRREASAASEAVGWKRLLGVFFLTYSAVSLQFRLLDG